MDTTKGPANSIIKRAPGGRHRDKDDDYQARQGRLRYEGILVSNSNRPVQPPPMFFTHDHHPLPLIDHFKGHSAFLVAGGPSVVHGQDQQFIANCRGLAWAKDDGQRQAIMQKAEELAAKPRIYDLQSFYQPGVWSITINNACRVVKSDAWACVDSPASFILSNWLNPKCMKFAPICHTQKTLFDSGSAWKMTDIRTMDCPNMVYYKRNTHFQAQQFLDEDTINWGCSADHGGGRSIMFATIRILYLLGFRRVFLVGVDMSMSKEQKYAFAQDRSKGSISGNQGTYALMRQRFGELRPIFESRGFQVFNCNPDSEFKVFDYMPFDEAVRRVQEEEMQGIDVNIERTEGMYDREAKIKEAKKKKKDRKAERRAKANAKKYSDDDRRDVKERLDKLRAELDDRKAAVAKHREQSPATGSDLQKKQWQLEADRLKKAEDDKRLEFRTCEDEKRVKWGEPPRWKLWPPKEVKA